MFMSNITLNSVKRLKGRSTLDTRLSVTSQGCLALISTMTCSKRQSSNAYSSCFSANAHLLKYFMGGKIFKFVLQFLYPSHCLHMLRFGFLWLVPYEVCWYSFFWYYKPITKFSIPAVVENSTVDPVFKCIYNWAYIIYACSGINHKTSYTCLSQYANNIIIKG